MDHPLQSLPHVTLAETISTPENHSVFSEILDMKKYLSDFMNRKVHNHVQT